jgi:hypothetical protein
MNVGQILKWVAGGVIAYIIVKFISNAIDQAEYRPDDSGITSPSWAAPIFYGTPVTGWYAPWQRPGHRRYGRNN